MSLPAATVEPRVIAALDKGIVSLREAMVNLLSKFDTPGAATALQAHLKKEKTACTISAIEIAQMAAGASGSQNDEGQDDATGYVALDGSRVDIPPRRKVQDDPSVKFGKDMLDRIQRAVEGYNVSALKMNAELTNKKQKWGHWRVVKSPANCQGQRHAVQNRR